MHSAAREEGGRGGEGGGVPGQGRASSDERSEVRYSEDLRLFGEEGRGTRHATDGGHVQDLRPSAETGEIGQCPPGEGIHRADQLSLPGLAEHPLPGAGVGEAEDAPTTTGDVQNLRPENGRYEQGIPHVLGRRARVDQ